MTLDELKKIPDLSEEQCGRVLAVITNALAPNALPKTERWIRSCFHKPSFLEMKLHAINEIMNYLGFNSTTVGRHGVWFVEAGDMDALTIVNVDGTWKVSTPLDEIDALEATLEEVC